MSTGFSLEQNNILQPNMLTMPIIYLFNKYRTYYLDYAVAGTYRDLPAVWSGVFKLFAQFKR